LNKKILLVLALVLLFASFSFAANCTGSYNTYKRINSSSRCPQPVRTVCDENPCANNTPPRVRITVEEPKCGGGCYNLAYTYGNPRWQCKMNVIKRVIESYRIEDRIYADPAKARCCNASGVRENNYSCGNRGCNISTGRCNPLQPVVQPTPRPVQPTPRPVQPTPRPVQPTPRPSVPCTIDVTVQNNRVCKWALFRGNYSTEVDSDGKRIYGTEINCGSLGCNKATGLCNTETGSGSTRSDTYCKSGVSDKTFIRFNYSDGTSREFAHTQCGSCEHCDDGECVPNSGSTAVRTGCTVSTNNSSGSDSGYYRVIYSYNGPSATVRVNPAPNPGTGGVLRAGLTVNREVYTGNGSSRSTAYFFTTSRAGLRSDYKPIFQPSSTWTCHNGSKVPVDSRGNKIMSRAVYCDLGCNISDGSCNDAQDMCTYNSDCPDGYICDSFSNMKACVPSGN